MNINKYIEMISEDNKVIVLNDGVLLEINNDITILLGKPPILDKTHENFKEDLKKYETDRILYKDKFVYLLEKYDMEFEFIYDYLIVDGYLIDQNKED